MQSQRQLELGKPYYVFQNAFTPMALGKHVHLAAHVMEVDRKQLEIEC